MKGIRTCWRSFVGSQTTKAHCSASEFVLSEGDGCEEEKGEEGIIGDDVVGRRSGGESSGW